MFDDENEFENEGTDDGFEAFRQSLNNHDNEMQMGMEPGMDMDHGMAMPGMPGMMDSGMPGMMEPDMMPGMPGIGMMPTYYDIDPMTGMPMNYRGPSENYLYGNGTSPEELTKLGFTNDEVSVLTNAQQMYGRLSPQKLAMPPFCVTSPVINARIMYAYNLCMGRTIVDTNDIVSVANHFKKLSRISGRLPDFDCSQFSVRRKFDTIPRTAVVAGLPYGSFYALNSNQYEMLDRSYKVVKIAKEWVTIVSTRRMSVGPEDRLNKSVKDRQWGIPGILVVEETGSREEHKPWIIRIHKTYCRLCNRFLVVVSKTLDEYAKNNLIYGYKFALSDGSILYMYARLNKYDIYGNPTDERVETPSHNKHIIDYGYYADEVKTKVDSAMNKLLEKVSNNGVGLVYSEFLETVKDFTLTSPYDGINKVTNCEDTLDESEVDLIEDDI